MQKVEQALIRLLNEENFWAYYLSKLPKVELASLPSTAGVGFTRHGNEITLFINPKLFNALDEKCAAKTLAHEVRHFVYEHLTRFNPKKVSKDEADLVNIALDLCINQEIPDLGVLYKAHGVQTITFDRYKELVPDLLANENADYYVEKLKEEQKTNKKLQKEIEKFSPNHDHFELIEGDLDANVKTEIITGSLLQSIKDLNYKPGVIPNNILALVGHLKSKSVNWRSVLRNFIKNSVNTAFKGTRMRPNRRLQYMVPGTKREYQTNIVIINDTSGSTQDIQTLFFNELVKMHAQGYRFKVIDCDAAVQRVYEFNPKKPFTAQGGGGTLYIPAFAEAIKHKADVIIFLGDGDCADHPTKPRQAVLWALPQNCNPPVNWGIKVNITNA